MFSVEEQTLPIPHVKLDNVENKSIMFKSDIGFKEHICIPNYMAFIVFFPVVLGMFR